MTNEIIYRGWIIDRYRKPDKCFYAYAPDYDGLTPSDTQCAPTLHGLCDEIDEIIARRDSDGTASAALCEDISSLSSQSRPSGLQSGVVATLPLVQRLRDIGPKCGPQAADVIETLYDALDAICSEFAQGHPLIVAGRAALAKSRGEQA